MNSELTRRSFLGFVPAAALLASAPSRLLGSQQRIHDGFPSHEPARAREMVGVSHGNFDRVKELLKESPELAKASWDWGFGDWETAIGAASHVGRKDIADVLMANGARPDIFTFAMMDNVAAIRAMIESSPALSRLPGPHGITLMRHAENGKATRVLGYLKSLPDADKVATSLPTDSSIYVGKYEHGLEISVSNERLTISRDGGSVIFLNRVEDHAFAPVGAPNVRIRFAVKNGKSTSLSVHEPMPSVTARRI